MDDGNPLGTPEAEITLRVDVSAYVDQKRASIVSHAQPGGATPAWSGRWPRSASRRPSSTEWFIERDAPPGPRDGFVLPEA